MKHLGDPILNEDKEPADDDVNIGTSGPDFSRSPIFDRAKMEWIHNKDIVFDALEALDTAKRNAGLILDETGPFEPIEPEVLAEISEKLLERWWYARLIKWLYRILREAPEGFVMSAEVVILHPIWERIRNSSENPRALRSWELFQDRFEKLLSDAWNNPATPKNVTEKIGHLQWMYLRWVSWNDIEAVRAFRDAYMAGDKSSLLPYAQILIKHKRYKAAIRVLEHGWSRYGSAECLRELSGLQFQLGNSDIAFDSYRKLAALQPCQQNPDGEPVLSGVPEGDEDWRSEAIPPLLPAGRLLNDFSFPRDFDALEANGVDGGLILHGHDKIQRLLSAAGVTEDGLQEWSPELIEFQLRLFQLLAIEYRFDGAANRYISYIMEMYEWDADKRNMLISILSKSPVARVYLRLSEWNQEECTRLDYDLNDPDDLAEVVEAHLHLAAEHLLSHESAPIINTLGDIAVRHGFGRLGTLAQELFDIQVRLKSVLIDIGEESREYFLECQRQAEKALEGRINYSGILSRVLISECELDYLPLRNLGVLVSMTLNAAILSQDIQYVGQLIERIDPAVLGAKWAKCLAIIFRYAGYENQALRFYCFADLRDREVVWPLLEMAIATQETATRVLDYIRQRPDCNTEYPIHLPTILSDLLVQERKDAGADRYDPELLTYLWEAIVVYEAHSPVEWDWSGTLLPDFPISRFGTAAACFMNAYSQWHIRAKQRLAEYYLYHSEYPEKSVILFRELYAETNDPTFLVDIARAEYASLSYDKNDPTYSRAEFLIDLLKGLPEDHPDRVSAYLQFSLGGSEEAFFRACSLIPTASKKQMSMIPEDLYDEVIDRILAEARRLEAKREENGDRLEAGEILRHLTYIRILTHLLGDTIDYAIGYVIDLTYYLSRFEDREDNAIILQFLLQYQDEIFGLHSHMDSVELLHSWVFEEVGGLQVKIEQMGDPLVSTCEAEMNHLVDMYQDNPKLHELLEEVSYLFRAWLDCPALADRYATRSASLRGRDPDCLPPKILPEGTFFAYNPSTILH